MENKIELIEKYDFRPEGAFYIVKYRSGRTKEIDTARSEKIPKTVLRFLRDKLPNRYEFNTFLGCMVATFAR